jgi:hypothetical protein
VGTLLIQPSIHALSRPGELREPSARGSVFAANVTAPRKGYQQDALFAGKKDELRGVSKDALAR